MSSSAHRRSRSQQDAVDKADSARSLRRLLESLATSGRPSPDESDLRRVKRMVRSDPDNAVPFAYSFLREHLARRHSQVRVSALQVTDALFQRSHAFRLLVVADLKAVLDLTVQQGEGGEELPPPRAAREQLKRLSLETVKGWVDKFGEGYRKLALAYNYLKQVRRVDFNDMEARSELQRRRDAERKRREDNVWRERAKKTREEMEEARAEMRECLVQIDNCLAILEEKEEGKDCVEEEVRELQKKHGIASGEEEAGSSSKEKEDDVVLENLRDQHRLLTSRLIPMTKKWATVLSKAGVGRGGDEDVVKTAIDAKLVLEEAREKVDGLGIDLDKKKKKGVDEDKEDGESSDDDDFVEVGEKDGYEEFPVEPDAAFAFDFAEAKPSTSAAAKKSPKSPEKRASSKSQPSISSQTLVQSTSSSSDWKLKVGRGEEDDPTTFAATVRKLKRERNVDISAEVSSSSSPKKSAKDDSSSSFAPRIRFDADLYNWGEKRKERRVLVDPEKLRFWGSSAQDTEGEIAVPGSADNARSIDFSGQFRPVEWSCRAPLPSGRLCPRRDREKCPLHGRVIPRDKESGKPSRAEDRMKEDEERERKAGENPDWQDPALLRDIEASTGVNLRVPKKGERLNGKKGKGKEKRHPGLVSIRAESDTARKRLEKKVFNRSSAKRVAATMNRQDANRHRDKFADQFNYVFTK